MLRRHPTTCVAVCIDNACAPARLLNHHVSLGIMCCSTVMCRSTIMCRSTPHHTQHFAARGGPVRGGAPQAQSAAPGSAFRARLGCAHCLQGCHVPPHGDAALGHGAVQWRRPAGLWQGLGTARGALWACVCVVGRWRVGVHVAECIVWGMSATSSCPGAARAHAMPTSNAHPRSCECNHDSFSTGGI